MDMEKLYDLLKDDNFLKNLFLDPLSQDIKDTFDSLNNEKEDKNV